MAAAKVSRSQGTMKAIVQEGSGSADVLHVRTVERPVVTDDRVLVRVHAASVNAADWHMVHGGPVVRAVAWAMRTPVLPIRGIDVAGVVETVGRDVTRFQPGDEVFGAGSGTFAEYTLAREDGLALKPPTLSFEAAAALPVAGVTALQGLRDTGHVQPGQRVVIYGAGGGVGTFAVQIATALGAQVTAVTSTRNLEVVRALGAGEVIDYTQVDVTQRSERYHVVFDVAANRSLADMMRILAPGGTLVLAGAAKGGALAIGGKLLGAQIRSRLLGQRVASFLARVTSGDLLTLGELVEAGKLRPAIDVRYRLERAADAVGYVGSGEARAKVVISVE